MNAPSLKRYVIYSDILGIYLGHLFGDQYWSKKTPQMKKSALTFTKGEAEEEVRVFNDSTYYPFPTYKLVEVHPDLPNKEASIEACSNALLPRW